MLIMIGSFKFFLNHAELFDAIHGKVYLTNGSETIDLSQHTTFAICSDCLLPLLLWISARSSIVFYDTPQLWLKKLQHFAFGLLLSATVFFACQYIASIIFQRYHRKLKFHPRETTAQKRFCCAPEQKRFNRGSWKHLPSLYDDIIRVEERNWKSQSKRRHQWKPKKDG